MHLATLVLLGVYTICMTVRTSIGALDRTCTPFTKSRGPHPHGMCGRRIDEMLSMLCISGYNERIYRNKREISSLSRVLTQQGILIPREKANSYLVKRSNFYEQGIVCECCYHRCNIMELFDYCLFDPDPFSLFKRSVNK